MDEDRIREEDVRFRAFLRRDYEEDPLGGVLPPDELKSVARTRKRARDTDLVEQAFRARILAWAAFGGVVFPLGIGYRALEADWPVPGLVLGVVAGYAGGVGGIYLLTRALMGGAAGVAARIYHPSGASTPSPPEYSYAASLAARGRYDEAIEAYRQAIAEAPAELEPYLRLARLHRDELGRGEEAAAWFRRALREARMEADIEAFVTRELVELYRYRLDRPERALVELARLAERHAGTPVGERARAELRALKRRLHEGGDA